MTQRIIIIGAGIVGASLAYHLAKSSAHVRVIDAQPAPHGVATPMSWGWINASWGNAPAYFHLRQHSMKLWRKLDAEVPGLVVNWSGGLLWDLPQAELLAFAAERNAEGYRVIGLDAAQALALEPNLKAVPDFALHMPDEGSVEGVHAVQQLFAAAQSHGAQIISNTTVQRLETYGGRVNGVMTADGIIEADVVVVAAGVGARALFNQLDLTLGLDDPAGLLVRSKPAPELLNGLILAPEIHLRQLADGRLLAGSDFVGSFDADDVEGSAAKLFSVMQSFVRGGEALQMEGYTVGYRPTPRDGVSAAGFVPGFEGLYLCASHSGITLAPALGALCSDDILRGVRHDLLKPFAPDRLLS